MNDIEGKSIFKNRLEIRDAALEHHSPLCLLYVCNVYFKMHLEFRIYHKIKGKRKTRF